mmetsp:Transcript_4232/g.12211  ORF Transcript_4232/g.12211 Transcript_4232/m.12211 type:complete len:118 (-) Transcript_4232:545-898(-)
MFRTPQSTGWRRRPSGNSAPAAGQWCPGFWAATTCAATAASFSVTTAGRSTQLRPPEPTAVATATSSTTTSLRLRPMQPLDQIEPHLLLIVLLRMLEAMAWGRAFPGRKAGRKPSED